MNENPSTAGAQLPTDPDLEVDDSAGAAPLAVHLTPRFLGLVFLGGTAGTAAREALSLAFPPVNGIPFALFAINVVGAFLLGVLLEALVRRGPDHGRRRTVRLVFGTGLLGGFTSYSALATDTASLLGSGATGSGIGFALGTVVIGVLATLAGISMAAALHRRRGVTP